MKIAFFSKYLPSDNPNGVSVQVHRLAQALIKRGHRVTCFSFSSRPLDACYDCVELKWKSDSRLVRKFLPAFAFSKVVTESYDCIHYHGDDYLCRGDNRRIRTFYGSAFQEAIHAGTVERFLYQSLFYLFELVSSLKKGVSVSISSNTGTTIPFIKECIPCGVPLDRYCPDPVKKTPYPSILFIGDLHSRKRGSLLLKLFEEELLLQHPDCTLTVVGPQRCSGKQVIYAGVLQEEELIAEYQRSWVYCLPSSYEGFGVPALEAMGCGTAVVGTKNAGIAEIISHDRNGLICETGELGKTLAVILSDHARRERICKEGLSTVQRFDIRRVAELYEALYVHQAATII